MIENMSASVGSQLAPQKKSWLLLVGILSFIVVAGFSVYFQINAVALNRDVQQLQIQKQNLDKPLSGESASKLNDLQAAVAIKSELQKIEGTQVKWSKLIEKIGQTIPKIKGSTDPIVVFRSYNGDVNGTITVNASTRSGSLDPFADAAVLIRSFSADPVFNHVFVPTLTKSIGSDGNALLNFTISFSYIQPNF